MQQKVSALELQRRLNSNEAIQLIDVRSSDEFAVAHVPHALNIPLPELESRIDDLDPNRTLVVLCQSGRRAEVACEQLRSLRSDLVILEGGTTAWQSAGLPVVGSKATRWSLERQVRFGAGLLVLLGTLLAIFANPSWIFLAMFVGGGLTFAGLTNFCGMAMILAKMPWNRAQITAQRCEA